MSVKEPSSPSPSTPFPYLPLTRGLTLAGVVLMMLCMTAWHFVREDGPVLSIWVLQHFPLAMFIPSLLRNRPKAYIGLCFVLLLYFIRAVEGLFLPSPAWIDYSLLSLSVVIFITSMFTARWLQRSPS